MPVSSKRGWKLSPLTGTLGGIARNVDMRNNDMLAMNFLCVEGGVFSELAGLEEEGQMGFPPPVQG